VECYDLRAVVVHITGDGVLDVEANTGSITGTPKQKYKMFYIVIFK